MRLATIASSSIRGFGLNNPIQRVALSYVFSANTTQTTITTSSLSGYIAGKTDLTITVNSGIYLYSTSTATPALTITGAATGDTITLVNNGYIMGMGGASTDVGAGMIFNPGFPGGSAISLGYSIVLTNNSYIGGGGGGGANVGNYGSGGGGAGGGKGGNGGINAGGAGGGPGSPGGNGTVSAGGGGGRIMPGVGGAGGTPGSGGGAGGGGGGTSYQTAGGSAGIAAVDLVVGGVTDRASTGGGGWGAKGGLAQQTARGGGTAQGGAGGNAITLNGYTVTYITTGTVYGAVA